MYRPAFTILLLSLGLLLAVAWAGWPDLEFALALEDAPLGWLQVAMLVACATAAGLRAMIRPGCWRWLILAAALLIAALDERFMLHEQLQSLLYYGPLAQRPHAATIVRCVTLAYLLGGLAMLAAVQRVMAIQAWRVLVLSVCVGAAAIALDLSFSAAWPQVLEETLEFLAESLFLAGLLTEFRIRVSRLH